MIKKDVASSQWKPPRISYSTAGAWDMFYYHVRFSPQSLFTPIYIKYLISTKGILRILILPDNPLLWKPHTCFKKVSLDNRSGRKPDIGLVKTFLALVRVTAKYQTFSEIWYPARWRLASHIRYPAVFLKKDRRIRPTHQWVHPLRTRRPALSSGCVSSL